MRSLARPSVATATSILSLRNRLDLDEWESEPLAAGFVVAHAMKDIFLSPGDLCERWNVDMRTLDKLPIPWVRLSSRVRRINMAFIVEYEQAQRLSTTGDQGQH